MIFGGYFLPVHFLGTRAISKLTRAVIQRKDDNLYFPEPVGAKNNMRPVRGYTSNSLPQTGTFRDDVTGLQGGRHSANPLWGHLPRGCLSCEHIGRVRRSRSLQFTQREAAIGERPFGPNSSGAVERVPAFLRTELFRICTDRLGRK